MALKSIRIISILSFIAIFCSTLLPTGKVHALMTDHDNNPDLPALKVFIEQVKNGQADELRGIYIPGILAARVVQQPAGIDDFVSPWHNIVTQFNLASKLGSIGLLAHNYLAGRSFALIQKGQEFHLINGDGQVSSFVVSEILRYQALETNSTSSTFVDLKNGDTLTSSELFTKVYDRPGQVVLQTCMYTGDNPTWGRLFIISESYLP